MFIAFHGDPAIKERYLNRVRAHRKAGEIDQRVYGWRPREGRERKSLCGAVGCTVQSDDLGLYEVYLGIPAPLAQIEQELFECLWPKAVAVGFPEQFLSAIPVGAMLHNIEHEFMLWLLEDREWGAVRFARGERERSTIEELAELHLKATRGPPLVVTNRDWIEADTKVCEVFRLTRWWDPLEHEPYELFSRGPSRWVSIIRNNTKHSKHQATRMIRDKLLELLEQAPLHQCMAA